MKQTWGRMILHLFFPFKIMSWWFCGQESIFTLQGAQVLSLVRELRSCMLRGDAKKTKTKKLHKTVSWSYKHNDFCILKEIAGWYSITLMWHTLISLRDSVISLFFFLGQCKQCYSEIHPSKCIFTPQVMDIGKISVGYVFRSGVAVLLALFHNTYFYIYPIARLANCLLWKKA